MVNLFSMRTLLGILFCFTVLDIATPGASWANFASNQNRVASPEFVRFYLKRFDPWFRANVFDYRKSLSRDEIDFADHALKTATAFGSQLPKGFLRSIEYNVSYDLDARTNGPIRFIAEEPKLVRKILAARKVRVANDIIGLGFFQDARSIELIFAAEKIPAELSTFVRGEGDVYYVKYASGKPVSYQALKLSSGDSARCAGVQSIGQVDKTISSLGDVWVSCHAGQFETRALAPKGQELVAQIRKGLNLSPGVVRWVNHPTRYELVYP